MTYVKQTIVEGETITTAWGNFVQTQYDEVASSLLGNVTFRYTGGVLEFNDGAGWKVDNGVMVKGTYTGDGTTLRTIALPRTPRYLIIRGNTTYNNAAANVKYEIQHTDKAFVFTTASSFNYVNAQDTYPRLETNGFAVKYDATSDKANKSTIVFDYIAFY